MPIVNLKTVFFPPLFIKLGLCKAMIYDHCRFTPKNRIWYIENEMQK